MENGTQSALEEMRAELQGIRYNVEALDENMRRWRDVTNTAFNLLSQREAKDIRERKERQIVLDRWLWWLSVGVGVCLLLGIVLLSMFIGSQLVQGVYQWRS